MPTETNKPEVDHEHARAYADTVLGHPLLAHRYVENLAAAYLELSERMERVKKAALAMHGCNVINQPCPICKTAIESIIEEISL